MEKNAYPHEENRTYIEEPHNISKWMQSMRNIYSSCQHGLDWQDSFEKFTSGWDVMEKNDFKTWMSFYQEDSHNKYKIAQFVPRFIDNGVGSYIPNDTLKASFPVKSPDMGVFIQQQEINNVEDEARRKEEVRKRIQSIIGRLNSAEKLATQPDVQLALKRSLEMGVDEWVSLLQKLKREIQLAPMRSAASPLLEDIIVKNANQLVHQGNRNAAKLLIHVAQTADPTAAVPFGDLSAPPAAAPDISVEDKPEDNEAMIKFMKGLAGDKDTGDASDVDDVNDSEDEDDPFADITVTAQAAPPVGRVSPPGNTGEDLEVSEDDEVTPEPKPNPIAGGPAAPIATPAKNTGMAPEANTFHSDPFDAALSSVKISDIVARLEGIASMFKNREIARQLSIIDLMMDKKGIAPYFPTLAEAMRSALESNQYCQSRVEEILAKLRGTIETPMSMHMESEISGDEAIQAHLAKEETQERARKEQRKQLAQQEADAAMAPPPAVENAPAELAAPTKLTPGPAAPVRPVG